MSNQVSSCSVEHLTLQYFLFRMGFAQHQPCIDWAIERLRLVRRVMT